MALASNVSLRFHIARIPLIEGALDCIRAGNIPGGLKNNRDFAECAVGYEEEFRELKQSCSIRKPPADC